jgi:hypothetical protein
VLHSGDSIWQDVVHTIFNKFCLLLHNWIRCELSSSSTRVKNLGVGICWVWCGRQSFQVKTLNWRFMGGTVLFKGCFQLWKGSVCSGAAYYSDSSKSFSGTVDELSPFRLSVCKRIWSFVSMDIACILHITNWHVYVNWVHIFYSLLLDKKFWSLTRCDKERTERNWNGSGMVQLVLLPVLLHMLGERIVLCIGLLGYGLQVWLLAMHSLSSLFEVEGNFALSFCDSEKWNYRYFGKRYCHEDIRS